MDLLVIAYVDNDRELDVIKRRKAPRHASSTNTT